MLGFEAHVLYDNGKTCGLARPLFRLGSWCHNSIKTQVLHPRTHDAMQTQPMYMPQPMMGAPEGAPMMMAPPMMMGAPEGAPMMMAPPAGSAVPMPMPMPTEMPVQAAVPNAPEPSTPPGFVPGSNPTYKAMYPNLPKGVYKAPWL